MHLCPHCEKRGIGFFAKLLSNPIFPADCRLCGRPSTKCAKVVWLQIGVAVAFLATVPNLLSGPAVSVLGAATAFVIIAIGQIGPLCRMA